MKKSLISLMLILAMLLSLSFTVQASIESLGEISTEEPVLSTESAVADRLEDMIFHFYCDVPGQYTVGDAIEIYNADTEAVYYMIPIFRGQECVGMAEISGSGNITLTDSTKLYDNLVSLEFENYLLYTTGGIVYAENLEETVELQDAGLNIPANDVFIRASFAEKSFGADSNTRNISAALSVSAVIDKTDTVVIINPQTLLRGAVPTVETDQCPITNFVTQDQYGICWAACVATIANYKKGLSLTAEAVAIAEGHTNYTDVEHYNGGTAETVVNALGDYALTYNISSGKLGWTDIKADIASRYPFVVGLTKRRFDVSLGKWVTDGHMLVGYGYSCSYGDAEADSDSRRIRVWDPNGNSLYFSYYGNENGKYALYGYEWNWAETVAH